MSLRTFKYGNFPNADKPKSGLSVKLIWAVTFILMGQGLFAQVENWVYRYSGPANLNDIGRSLTFDPVGNIYVAGGTDIEAYAGDAIVISLTSGGAERWRYQYNGPDNLKDYAEKIVYASDGNIYVAGASQSMESWCEYDVVVICLDTSGAEKWRYRYNGVGSYIDRPGALVYGRDGNIYVAGWTCREASETTEDILVISLTPTGGERWVYTYNGPGNYLDNAYDMVFGLDSNIYVTGVSDGGAALSSALVISLGINGNERWVYQYNGSGYGGGFGHGITYGTDGNIYLAADDVESGTNDDFVVISLDNSGHERWVYRRNGAGVMIDGAYDVTYGSDGNVYATGHVQDSVNLWDFTVVSLTSVGNERWLYRYSGSANYFDEGEYIIEKNGIVYATGYSNETGHAEDIAVISLNNMGKERWVYTYNGPASGTDRAFQVDRGSDGNIYVVGNSSGVGTSTDFTVIGLDDPLMVIEENKSQQQNAGGLKFEVYPNPATSVIYLRSPLAVKEAKIYDVAGKLIKRVSLAGLKGEHEISLKGISSGIYFLSVFSGKVKIGEIKLVRP